jgi:hypothetical protein
MRVPSTIGVAIAVGAALVAVLPFCRPGGEGLDELGGETQTLAARSNRANPVGRPTLVRWIVAGGGALPELNQVQIEQDIGLVEQVFSPLGRGRILFGAGAQSPSVQVLAPEAERDPVLEILADLFAPRGGRDAHYRVTTLPVDGEATASTVSSALRGAVADRGAPLVVVLAGHGNRGETARDNTVDLWARSSLTVAEVAAILDEAQREVRMVATTCFSGGFAEIVFHGADAAAGPARTTRCGFFATVWDLEAAGCDPNPDRAAQEGYALHFFNALAGRDRHGDPLDPAVLDLDGDGTISLYEAHTRVRTVSDAADVPTTTSERWLREVAPSSGPSLPFALPEDDALVTTLVQRLALRGDESAAFVQLQHLEDRIEASTRALEQAQSTEDDTYRTAAAGVLARWPVLDDPWHPDFTNTLTQFRTAIAEHVRSDDALSDYHQARADVDRLRDDVAQLRRRAAWLERLTRALDNRTLAARLHAVGGPDWETYESFLACERAGLADSGPPP